MKNKNKTSFRLLYAFIEKKPTDLSLSENPLGCSPTVIAALKKIRIRDVSDYPDGDSMELKVLISSKLKINTDNIFVTNGLEAAIKMLPQALLKPKDEVVIPELTFPMFEIAVKQNGNKIVESKMSGSFDIDFDDIERKVTSNTKLIFICNPNNPTGRVIKREKVLSLVRSTNAFVVDEAGIEFGGKSVVKYTKSLRNLIVLRTFSKGFGLGGLRIGFMVANSSIVIEYKRISQPFPLSNLSLKAAAVAFQDDAFITESKLFMKEQRKFLTRELRKRSFKVIESNANNLFVKVTPLFASSSDFVSKLSKKGVSIIDGKLFNRFTSFVRVSPRLRHVNVTFIKKVDEIM